MASADAQRVVGRGLSVQGRVCGEEFTHPWGPSGQTSPDSLRLVTLVFRASYGYEPETRSSTAFSFSKYDPYRPLSCFGEVKNKSCEVIKGYTKPSH